MGDKDIDQKKKKMRKFFLKPSVPWVELYFKKDGDINNYEESFMEPANRHLSRLDIQVYCMEYSDEDFEDTEVKRIAEVNGYMIKPEAIEMMLDARYGGDDEDVILDFEKVGSNIEEFYYVLSEIAEDGLDNPGIDPVYFLDDVYMSEESCEIKEWEVIEAVFDLWGEVAYDTMLLTFDSIIMKARANDEKVMKVVNSSEAVCLTEKDEIGSYYLLGLKEGSLLEDGMIYEIMEANEFKDKTTYLRVDEPVGEMLLEGLELMGYVESDFNKLEMLGGQEDSKIYEKKWSYGAQEVNARKMEGLKKLIENFKDVSMDHLNICNNILDVQGELLKKMQQVPVLSLINTVGPAEEIDYYIEAVMEDELKERKLDYVITQSGVGFLLTKQKGASYGMAHSEPPYFIEYYDASNEVQVRRFFKEMEAERQSFFKQSECEDLY